MPQDCSKYNPKFNHLFESNMANKDCLHLQLYRDSKDRFKKGKTKASLSLQHFLGFESGFTLDKESNTIAIICQDLIVVLAFEIRERLIAWQVKVGTQLGPSTGFLVMIGGGSKKLPAGPARLHLQGRKFAITSGVPPRLLGLWKLAHLRRYGVVEGRFCFEGGSHCGKGEGLHMLITDQAQDIADAFNAAAHGNQAQRTPSKKNNGNNRSQTRLSDNTDQSLPESACGLYEENFFEEDSSGISQCWPSDERGFDEQDYQVSSGKDVVTKPPWNGADHVTLERCSNCLTKLGVTSKSSTVALTPNAQFNPAWTMELLGEKSPENFPINTDYLTPISIKKQFETCQCVNEGPQRPPKPACYESMKPPSLLPQEFSSEYSITNLKFGPYENYDVPKTSYTEVENTKYYDTPKRMKQVLADDLFQVKKSSTPGTLILQKKCGCMLKFASNEKTVIVECDDNIQTIECPCQKVTNWANNLISLPYCKRSPNTEKTFTDVLTLHTSEESTLYATVDLSRKPKRHSNAGLEKEPKTKNYKNIEGSYANYENLEFALSLEYYENAKGLLKKAGVTQSELDALSTNAEMATSSFPKKVLCTRCTTHSNNQSLKNKNDEYLLMEPPKDSQQDQCQSIVLNPGYTSMTPKINWSQSLKHPCNKLYKTDIEKSLSNPALNENLAKNIVQNRSSPNSNHKNIQQRSSSVDSANLLKDLNDIDSIILSHATSSSLETLKNMPIDRRISSLYENGQECNDYKFSGSDNKMFEESSSQDVSHLRNKLIDNAQIKRSSSVPCKSGGNRDSSSSNDSGVSSCSIKHSQREFHDFEMPSRLHSSQSGQYNNMIFKKMRGNLSNSVHLSLPRKSKSSDLNNVTMQLHRCNIPAKSSSAEAEVPVLPPKHLKSVMDAHSTSSGTSDMSDYIETLSLTSSHSSSDTQSSSRINRQPTNKLRPRSGKEYHNLDQIVTSMYKRGKKVANYTNLP